ncbi:MAG: HAD family hydrolase [Nitrospiraceae bacterium]
MPLRAIIFDFNGVIVDDETQHFLTFQQALREHGLTLAKDDYYGTYLGMDERHCAEALLRCATGASDPARVQAIVDRKAALFKDQTARHKPQLFPGIVEFVTQAGMRYRLAIATGGRREQLEFALRGTRIEQSFDVIVSAEDTPMGKPDPAIYHRALKLLNRAEPRPPLIRAAECLVIEDSRAGIRAAVAAGMKVIGLSTTYPPEQLAEARLVLPSLERVALARLESLFVTE